LFSDQKDEFVNLLQGQGQPQKNNSNVEKKEHAYIPKQSSSKNLPTQNNRQVSQNQNMSSGSMIKGAPNMESTTSLHSTATEGDIKKGVGIRKGIIPGGLFD